MLLQIRAKLDIFTLKITVSVRNQGPRDDATDCCESRTNQEHSLGTLLLIGEGVLDGREDLSTNGSTCLANGSCEAKEMPANGSWERLCAAEERGDLSLSAALSQIDLGFQIRELTPGPISPSELKMP